MDHDSEQHLLHHAMLLHCGGVADRRPGNLYSWGYCRGGAPNTSTEKCTFHPLRGLAQGG